MNRFSAMLLFAAETAPLLASDFYVAPGGNDAVWMDLDPKALDAFSRFSGDLIDRLETYAARAGGEE